MNRLRTLPREHAIPLTISALILPAISCKAAPELIHKMAANTQPIIDYWNGLNQYQKPVAAIAGVVFGAICLRGIVLAAELGYVITSYVKKPK